MKNFKSSLFLTIILLALVSMETNAQLKLYRTNGAETILSGGNISYDNLDVNSNLRFTLFFHGQQMLNLDFNKYIGVYTGLGIRNIGFITEDLYQNMGFLDIDATHPDWNKNTKMKRRAYTLGVPFALKLGNLHKDVFLYGGGEYEYTFHYKQKLFIDDEKYKYSEWTSDRVNAWLPSVFAGIQFPGGVNLKVKYYMDNFLNPGFTGIDFDENVDYSRFNSTGIWYISIATIINKKRVQQIVDEGRKS